MTNNRNGYVSWQQLTGVLIAVCGATAGAYWGVETWTWNAHTQSAHPSAVSQVEYDRDQRQMDERLSRNFGRIDKSLEKIETKIDTLLKRAE